MRYLLLAITLPAALLLVSCTSMKATRLDAAKYPVKQMCIEENTEVSHIGVLRLIEGALQERGIDSFVFRGATPTQCRYTMIYSASNAWDLVTFLRSADFKILMDGKTIAEASYFHGGGFDFSKFASAEAKLSPVFDALLSDFKRLPVTSTITPSGSSKFDEIRELKKLLDEGVITQQEFQREKERLLSKSN